MDDANMPNLLGLPLIGFISKEDQLYKETRKFILSNDNPYFFSGSFAQGIHFLKFN
jgi:meiotically up-regulated gene 157 (Mug157) protein